MSEDIKQYAKLNDVPIIKDDGIEFIKTIIFENKIKKILELGSAIGYSAIEMAKVFEDTKIITLEKNKALYEQCLKNVSINKLDKQIVCINKDIDDFETDELFDLIFVDAAKAQYFKYFNKFKDNLGHDGIMIFDNLNFHNLYLEPEKIKSKNLRSLVKKINAFYEKVSNIEGYDVKIRRDVGDGILVLRRSQICKNTT